MKYFSYILFAMSVATYTHGCSFTPEADIFKTAEENYPQYSYVFSGTIEEKSTLSNLETEYTFQVSDMHKGNITTERLFLVSPGHSCGFFSEVGVHMLVMTNDLGSIDESTVKYFFSSVSEAFQAGASLELGYASSSSAEHGAKSQTQDEKDSDISLTNFIVPSSLPTEAPEVNFTPPTSPPPFDNSLPREIDQEEEAGWFKKIWAWITRLLSF